ncbi:MAG: hypothetical protein PHI31_11225 [Desulfuromonadaceae bacterium]|nr:hypothetical protein [Desulfuromonadaceae bacterium]
MLIPILRTDNYYDYVKGFVLDSLIEANEIVKFKRASGWVTVGRDKIRSAR